MEPITQHVTLSSCAKVLESQSEIDMFNYYLNLTLSFARSTFNFILSYYLYILIAMIILFVLYDIYISFWGHISDFKDVADVGFDHIKPGSDRLAKISRAQNARQVGIKLPPPYPNGWFAVMEIADLGATGVVPVDVLGLNLCVYRGEDGIPRCVDAYCPHLGANLGVGGNVSGNCIECPFHKWKFGEDGVCVSVPGVEHAPRGVSIKTWTTVEADGHIWIWYDAEGREPQWAIQDAPELKSWGYRGKNEFLINSHIQDVNENTADMAHLNALHHSSIFSDLGEKYPSLLKIIGYYAWTAKWFHNDDHTCVMDLKQDYTMLNGVLFHMDVKANLVGPGHVRIFLETPIGPMLIIQSLTPLEPLLQKMTHKFYSPFYNALLVPVFVKAGKSVLSRDVFIWNTKKFINSPAYVQSDKSIKEYRSWFSQFYSENSTSFRDAIQNPLDW